MEIRTDAHIAVIGAGTMGIGIAQVAATAGHHVTILDTNPNALERGEAELRASLDAAVGKGRLCRRVSRAFGDYSGPLPEPQYVAARGRPTESAFRVSVCSSLWWKRRKRAASRSPATTWCCPK
ncbi:MAG: NAD-binding protein [Sphingomonas sp.]|nr:NAD-binding protein [Sphingomonas sp.]